MSDEYVHFNNNTQPAINEDNLNRMQQLIKQDINGAVSGDTLPVGVPLPFAGGTVPDNYLLCDGRAVSRTDYAQLFNVIGTYWGPGDGSTTFNIPDLRGKTFFGYDPNQTEFNAIGKTGGEKEHTQTLEELYPHQHKLTIVGGGTLSASGVQWSTGSTMRKYAGDMIESTGGGQPMPILNPYGTGLWIIKAFQTAGVVAEVVNAKSTSTTNVYSADYINKMFDFSQTYNYSGSVMTSSNGTVQSYSNINFHVNALGTLAYAEGTLYNNHSTAGGANVTFNSALRPSSSKSALNIQTNYNNALTGENMTIGTDGKVTMQVYGPAGGNSRHSIIPTLIWL